jgi:hypothetical protein
MLGILRLRKFAGMEDPRRHRRPHDHLDDIRRQSDDLVHPRA